MKVLPKLVIIGFALIFLFTMSHSTSSDISAAQGDPPLEAGTVSEDLRGFEMVYVPAGRFELGVTPDVLTQVNEEIGINVEDYWENFTSQGIFDTSIVELPAFWIDRYEVTIAQFTEIRSTCVAMGQCEEIDLSNHPELTTDPQQPQVAVSWFEALRICNSRSAHLPTEAEWEYAASGPENNAFPWGNEPINDNVRQRSTSTYPVGSVPDNISWVGTYDMAGNAAEWVEDRFGPYPRADQIWSGTDVDRVVRGGSYVNGISQMATYERSVLHPIDPNVEVGFRCVRYTDPRGSD